MAYSDDQKAVALATLAAVGRNYREASRRTGIPHVTIMKWDRGENLPSDGSVVEKATTKKGELADNLEALAYRLVESVDETVIDTATLSQRMTAFGIAVDKMRLLREQPSPDAQALAGVWTATQPILAEAGIELDNDDSEADSPDA